METINRFEHSGIDEQAQKQRKFLGDTLDGVVSMGLSILQEDGKGKRAYFEQVPLMMQLRHLVELVDSVAILIRNGSVNPAYHLLRSVLESMLHLKFLLGEDAVQKCKSYIVASSMEQLEFLYTVKASPQAQAKPELYSTVDVEIEQLEKRLKLEELKDVHEALMSLKKGNKIPKWYNIFKANTIRDIARACDEEMLYKHLYSDFSMKTHGVDVITGNLYSKEGFVGVKPIRQANEIGL